MSKKLITVIVVALGLMSYVLLKPKTNHPHQSRQNALPIVAITQIIEHPSLDAERFSLIETLKKAGFEDGKQIKIVFQSAQGNIPTAVQIAKQLISLKPKVIVAISTPSAISVWNERHEENIPILFSAVTDPSRLVGKNISGVSDYVPPRMQLELIRMFHPHLTRLGFIYNPGEINSRYQLQQMRDIAKGMGFEIIESPIHKTSDAAAAVQCLADKVDAICVPTDNTGVAAIKSIVQSAVKLKLPVYPCDVGSVESGAIATQGYDRKMLGGKVGEMVVKILQGVPLSQIPIEKEHTLQVVINKSAAQNFGVTIPDDLKEIATMVGEDM